MIEKDKKIVICTCITGKYDTPIDNFITKPGYDYIILSDENITTNCWKCIVPDFNNMDHLCNTKKQRFVKTHPHHFFTNYDIVVWIDANTTINDNLYKYIENNINHPITFKVHPVRNCIYKEINEVKVLGKDNTEICNKLWSRYKNEGYPENIGLYETNIIISHPDNTTVQLIFDSWWNEIEHNSKRDQLSLNYILWKNNLTEFPNSVVSNLFTPKPHFRMQ